MAVTTHLRRSIVDEEPGAYEAVTVRGPASDVERENLNLAVLIEQDDDRIYMSLEHARAVHAALGALIEESAA